MKRTLIFGLITILLLPLLMIGCKTEEATTSPIETQAPDTNGIQRNITQDIDVTLDKFMTQNNIVKDVNLTHPDSLIVSLGSNPTTGYEWSENATIVTAQRVIVQQSYKYVAPTATNIVGAGGTSVWTFATEAAGTATIKLSYGRPWEGGEKDTYTLTINVTVK